MGDSDDLSKMLGEAQGMTRHRYELLRITKTGSESLLRALRMVPTVTVHEGVEGHAVRLEDVPDDAIPIISLRDPVERFRSGYDMNARTNYGGMVDEWPTANDLAQDIAKVMWDMKWGFTFLPQVYWVRGVEYLLSRKPMLTMTEDIDSFIVTFPDGPVNAHKQRYNAQTSFRGLQPSKLSPVAIRAVREAYAADMHMLQTLGVPDRYFKHLQGRL